MIEAILRVTATALLVMAALWLLRKGPAHRRVLTSRVGLFLIVLAAIGVRLHLPNPAEPLMLHPDSASAATAEPNWLPAIVWAGGALLATMPLAFGWLRLRRLWRAATPAPTDLSPDIPAKVGHVPSPLVFGFPGKLLLPVEFSSWSSDQQRGALEHEFAHVRAMDPGWIVVFGLGKATFWWHPLVHALSKSHRRDIELAADEAALMAGIKPTDYAQTLLTLAQLPKRPMALGCPAAGVGTLEGRIRHALDFAKIDRRLPKLVPITGILAASAALLGFAEREIVLVEAALSESAVSRPQATAMQEPPQSVVSNPQTTRSTKRSARKRAVQPRSNPVSAVSKPDVVAERDPISAPDKADPFGPGSKSDPVNGSYQDPFKGTGNGSAFPKMSDPIGGS